jgi:hypothetical protein
MSQEIGDDMKFKTNAASNQHWNITRRRALPLHYEYASRCVDVHADADDARYHYTQLKRACRLRHLPACTFDTFSKLAQQINDGFKQQLTDPDVDESDTGIVKVPWGRFGGCHEIVREIDRATTSLLYW